MIRVPAFRDVVDHPPEPTAVVRERRRDGLGHVGGGAREGGDGVVRDLGRDGVAPLRRRRRRALCARLQVRDGVRYGP